MADTAIPAPASSAVESLRRVTCIFRVCETSTLAYRSSSPLPSRWLLLAAPTLPRTGNLHRLDPAGLTLTTRPNERAAIFFRRCSDEERCWCWFGRGFSLRRNLPPTACVDTNHWARNVFFAAKHLNSSKQTAFQGRTWRTH